MKRPCPWGGGDFTVVPLKVQKKILGGKNENDKLKPKQMLPPGYVLKKWLNLTLLGDFLVWLLSFYKYGGIFF